MRWTAYLQDIDIAGTFTAASRVGIKNFEDIRFADQFAGGTVTQQIDAALADISSVGLVVVPSSMGAGNATAIVSGKAILDLRAGVPKFFTNNSVSTASWQLNNDGTVTSLGLTSATANPATTGFIRAAKSDVFYYRNNGNTADLAIVSLDSSNGLVLGTTAGVTTAGPLVVSGSITGTQIVGTGQFVTSLATGTAPLNVTSTTVCPNLNVQVINGVTVSGAPAASGYSLVSTGTTTAGWSANASTYKLESMQYTPVTFVSSAGGAYFTYALPANELAVGQALRFTFSGTWTNTSGVTRTYTFTLKAGATTLLSWTLQASNAAATNIFMAKQLLVICTAAGSGGTVEVQAIDPPGPISGGINPTGLSGTANTATIAFDTTIIESLTVNVVQTNDATTATTGRQFMVERLG